MSVRTIAVVTLFAAAVSAQGPPPQRDQPPIPQTGTAVIRGRVVHAETGEPLRRVLVRVQALTATEWREPPAAMTDDEGRYELTQLPAGRYQLKASRGGYVEIEYGQRRPFERGRPLDLRDGELLENIDFSLPRGAVITGRIVDEAGELVAHASVSLARYRYTNGARRLTMTYGGSTDDRGEFRVFGVPPGEYYVVARFGESDFGLTDRVRYVPTYYPGTPAVTDALRVTIGVGQEISGIVIALTRARTSTISGVVRAADNSSRSLFPPFVVAREADEVPGFGRTHMSVAGPDGSFTIGGLLPTAYILEARSSSNDEFASADVVIDSRDVTGVALVLSKGAAARGRIRFDTGAPPADVRPAQVLVVSSSVDPNETSFSSEGRLRPMVRDDWTFELEGLRGRRLIRAGSFTTIWEMKSIHLNGTDVTDVPVDFRNGDVDGLDIVLTQRLTDLSGSVTDARGATATDATVVVFAEDRDRWRPQSRFIMSARPDQQGRFNIRGLPAGRYLAVAVDFLEPGEEQNPELLEQWRAGATSLTLAEGETRVIDLKLSAF